MGFDRGGRGGRGGGFRGGGDRGGRGGARGGGRGGMSALLSPPELRRFDCRIRLLAFFASGDASHRALVSHSTR